MKSGIVHQTPDFTYSVTSSCEAKGAERGKCQQVDRKYYLQSNNHDGFSNDWGLRNFGLKCFPWARKPPPVSEAILVEVGAVIGGEWPSKSEWVEDVNIPGRSEMGLLRDSWVRCVSHIGWRTLPSLRIGSRQGWVAADISLFCLMTHVIHSSEVKRTRPGLYKVPEAPVNMFISHSWNFISKT